MTKTQKYCECCGKLLKPDSTVWLELNQCTGEWAVPGESLWSGTNESQGVFSMGKTCAKKILLQEQEKV